MPALVPALVPALGLGLLTALGPLPAGAAAPAATTAARPADSPTTVRSASAAVPAAAPGADGSAAADENPSTPLPTNRGDDARDGWYPDEPGLAPETVGSSDFGQLFSAAVSGQVYAQPLVTNGTLLVATEADWIYGLDPATGTVRWERQLGTPVPESVYRCTDIYPEAGVTSTPTVDPATGIAYVVDVQYLPGSSTAVGYFLNAIDPSTGDEEPGFEPVEIGGTASNNPQQTFQAAQEFQRAGLLLLDGVVYVAFAGHCDAPPYAGWVVGVSTKPGKGVTTLWTSMGRGAGAASGGGIWQSGGGLVSDGPGRILLATGNGPVGESPSGTIPGSDPPGVLSESVVRLAVKPGGSLRAADFFTPYDAEVLDQHDLDFGSGAPVALPPQFGTPAHPRLMVEVGKEGYVYLLDRDDLGGVGQGPGGGDAAVARVGPDGGVWSSPGVWPGDGGYLYIPTASGSGGGQGALDTYRFSLTGGQPTLVLTSRTAQRFGLGSSSPVVTSDGTTSGSAVVWLVHMDGPSATDAALQAYDALPVNGQLQMIGQWPIGLGTKYTPPGVAGNRVYVGGNGQVDGFGAPVSPNLSGTGYRFDPTVEGSSSEGDVTLTAHRAVTVRSLTSSNPAFVLGAPSPAVPAELGPGETLTVPVTFSPDGEGQEESTLTVRTGDGEVLRFPLSGTGLANGPFLEPQTAGLSMGGAETGVTISAPLTFTNLGSEASVIDGASAPPEPFSVDGLPPAATSVAPGSSVTVTVEFRSVTPGLFQDPLVLHTASGDVTVTLSASATTHSVLRVTPPTLRFGPVPIGTAVTRTLTFSDVGGSVVTLEKSKTPAKGPFVVGSPLAEGTTFEPGASRHVKVTFIPAVDGPVNGGWTVNSSGDEGLQAIHFTGTGTGPGGLVHGPAGSGWQRNGSAATYGSLVQLTPAVPHQAASTYWRRTLGSPELATAFDLVVQNGTGGIGTALVLARPDTPPTSLGTGGLGLGFAGTKGVAVTFTEAPLPGEREGNDVGVTDGPEADGTGFHWLARAHLRQKLRDALTRVVVSVDRSQLVVRLGGRLVLSTRVNLPPRILLGFTASTKNLTDQHLLLNGWITSDSTRP